MRMAPWMPSSVFVKKASKPLRDRYGHTPLSLLEPIPWDCRLLVVGTGAEGALPIEDAVFDEADRRGVELIALPGSKIREVANAGLDRSDVLAFWFGESDEATPPEVREAAMQSLARGETFYAHNLGLAELRESLRALVAR